MDVHYEKTMTLSREEGVAGMGFAQMRFAPPSVDSFGLIENGAERAG